MFLVRKMYVNANFSFHPFEKWLPQHHIGFDNGNCWKPDWEARFCNSVRERQIACLKILVRHLVLAQKNMYVCVFMNMNHESSVVMSLLWQKSKHAN